MSASYPALAFVFRADCNSKLSLQISKSSENEFDNVAKVFANAFLVSMVTLSVFSTDPLPALADGQTEKFKLPPVDLKDKNRCKLSSSTIGQANAARDKLYDLRQCNLSGENAAGFDLSGVIMTATDVSKANFQDAFFSKGYLHGKRLLTRGFWNNVFHLTYY